MEGEGRGGAIQRVRLEEEDVVGFGEGEVGGARLRGGVRGEGVLVGFEEEGGRRAVGVDRLLPIVGFEEEGDCRPVGELYRLVLWLRKVVGFEKEGDRRPVGGLYPLVLCRRKERVEIALYAVRGGGGKVCVVALCGRGGDGGPEGGGMVGVMVGGGFRVGGGGCGGVLRGFGGGAGGGGEG